MKILICGSKTYYPQFIEFGKELEKLGIDYKVEKEKGFNLFGRSLFKWLKARSNYRKLMRDYKPDVVLVDSETIFAEAAIKEKIPLFIFLRGNYWDEMKMARDTLFKYPPKRITLWLMNSIAEKCFKKSACILPVCSYLENIVKKRYPDKSTTVLHPGIDHSIWYPQEGMELKHPCVGLVQAANIWGKTKEMLILPKILEAMPDVTFYWAGDGPYRDKILPQLEKYDNFKWLGSLEYPVKVRQFLSEIDVYALVSGLDMAPVSLLEAQLLKKPVIASNVGGIPETMKDKETGFLVGLGNTEEWINKLSILINKKETVKPMGDVGLSFVNTNFSWKVFSKNFLDAYNKIYKGL